MKEYELGCFPDGFYSLGDASRIRPATELKRMSSGDGRALVETCFIAPVPL